MAWMAMMGADSVAYHHPNPHQHVLFANVVLMRDEHRRLEGSHHVAAPPPRAGHFG